MESMITRSGLA